MRERNVLSIARELKRSARRLLSDVITTFEFSRHRDLRQFKGIHARDERCFILGNGPSIKQMDLEPLRNEVTFVVNWFVKHPDFDNLGIKYYCSSDPVHWHWQGSEGMPPGLYEPLERHPEIVKFFEHTAEPILRRQGVLQDASVHFMRLDYSRGVYEGHVSLDISKRVFHGHTVLIDFCLPIAYYMGFRKFYLLGVDLDYGVDVMSAAEQADSYFYEQADETYRPVPDYIRKGQWVRRVLDSFTSMRGVFEADGRRIYNAGIGGKLEVFERVDFERLLNLSSFE